MQTVNLLIKGKVQGVYYRNAAKEEADKLGITGWIKYISEGRVEAMATGNEEQLQAIYTMVPKRAGKSNCERCYYYTLISATV